MFFCNVYDKDYAKKGLFLLRYFDDFCFLHFFPFDKWNLLGRL